MQRHHCSTGRRASRLYRHLRLLVLGSWLLLASIAALAQPAGWTYTVPITVTENSGAVLTGYQLRLTLDTSDVVARQVQGRLEELALVLTRQNFKNMQFFRTHDSPPL